MNGNKTRFVGEFIVIVVGVLVALAVDDFRDYLRDRELEAHLLERLEDDLTADVADLALAELVIRRRSWLFGEIDAAVTTGRAPMEMPDSVARLDEVEAALAAAGRGDAWVAGDEWTDVLRYPLWGLDFTPEFDQADDAFQEMIVGGTLRTLRDPDLRSEILAYYRTSRDMAANAMSLDDYNLEWIQLLLDEGYAVNDDVSLTELIEVIQADRRLETHVRHALNRSANQAEFLETIGRALEGLRESLRVESGG